MNNHVNLISYITTYFPEVSEQNLLRVSELDENLKTFSNFLQNTIVIPRNGNNSNQRVLTDLTNNTDSKHQSYNEFINDFLTCSREANGLTLPGINDVSRSGRTTSNPYLNFQVHVLKDALWARLCDRIGRKRFVELLNSNICFIYHPETNTYACLFESRKANMKKSKELIYKRRMFYRWRWHYTEVQLITSSADDLTRLIFNVELGTKNLPKKYRKILRILQVAKKNEERLKYRYIFTETVEERSSNQSVFKNSSKFLDVLRFIFIVIDKTFPRDAFGYNDNRGIIRRKIVEILSAQRLETFEINFLSSNLKLSTIPWLGKSQEMKSVQDRNMRQEMCSHFLRWFFGNYLLKLVRSFWYVTDFNNESTDKDITSAFFTHATWNRLSGNWLNGYIEKYLIEISDENNLPSKYNHGILRLIPKKSDFRPLCVPMRQKNGLKDGRHAYDRDIIRPVRDILRNQQKKVDADCKIRCYSVRDICVHLSRFANTLGNRNDGQIPSLYGVKFDMKHCYDNLNQAKIIECIELLFHDESREEKFYVRNYLRHKESSNYRKMFTSIAKRKQIVNFNIFDYPPSTGGRNVYSDQCRTVSFTRGDIIDIVKDHVLSSTIEIPQRRDKIFTRRIGVFQGFPLLATFCDIVYNSLVDEVLLPAWENLESILLRLADDFLFLSTEKKECDEILRLATSRRATEYGAFVNNEKCSTVNHENPILHFVGLEIDIRTLSYRRNNVLAYKTYTNKSFKTVLSHLEWSFNLKLNDFTLDTTMVTTEAILDNVRDMMGLVLDSVKMQMPKREHMPSDEIERLEVFILSITKRTLIKIKYLNDNDDNLVESVSHICAQEIHQRFGDLLNMGVLV